MLGDVVKIFIPTAGAFFIGVGITPIATYFFYKYKMWKKKVRTEDTISSTFALIHKDKAEAELSVPCVGGIIIWVSVILTLFLFYFLSFVFPNSFFGGLNFFSRSQTLLPFGILVLGAVVGLVDDVLEIIGKSHITRKSAWYTRAKILIIILCGLIGGLWFFSKLGMVSIHVPFGGELYLGILIIPLFIIVALATFSGGVIDGIDGLSGGVLASIFGAYTVVAFLNNQLDLAAFSGVITGAILAFLWFNIPPARFYMGETGMMPLTLVLATLAFMTNSVLILPIIAMPLVVTSLSSSIQMFSKKYFGKRVFLVAPLHHHFEALGWPSYKVTMRFWIFGFMFAIIGVILSIVGK